MNQLRHLAVTLRAISYTLWCRARFPPGGTEGSLSRLDNCDEVIGEHPEVRARFLKEFGPGVQNFVILACKVHTRLEQLPNNVPRTMRAAFTEQYLFQALNSLVTAMDLLVGGHLIPSGGMMRNYGESLATALLLSHPKLDHFARFIANPSRFPVHRSLDQINRNKIQKVLGIGGEEWRDFRKMIAWYDRFSHPSILATATLMKFDEPGSRILGGEYDAEKHFAYNKEFRVALNGCTRILAMIDPIESHLEQAAGESLGSNWGTEDKDDDDPDSP